MDAYKFNPWGAPDFPSNAAFGTGAPAEDAQRQPNILDKLLAGFVNSSATLPRRAIQNAQYSLATGTYDPGPTLDAAMLPMGTGALAGVPVKAGEAILGSGIIRDIKSSMTKMTPDMVDAYQLGEKLRAAKADWSASKSPTGSFDYDLAYGHIPGISEADAERAARFTPVLDAFHQSGLNGMPPPTYSSGSRFGDAPQDGRSWNYRENAYEPGVSMARVDHPDFKDYEWADMGGNRQRATKDYEGWLLPFKGTDDEPLMVGLTPKIGNK